MGTAPAPHETSEAVAVFARADQLEAAIDDLLTAGFDRADLCLLADEDAVVAKLGHRYRKVEELEDDRGVPRECYVAREDLGNAEGGLIGGFFYVGACAATGAILASGGTLIPAIIGAALAGGASGLIGSALARRVGRNYAEHLQEQLRHGGLLLWVRTHDEGHERRAVEILRRNAGGDVHLHGVPDLPEVRD